MHEHVFGQKEDPYTESKGVRPRGLSTTEEGGGHSFRNMNTVPFA